MPTISLKNIIPFDAASAQHVSFELYDAQSFANTIRVYNNSSNALVYTHTETTYALSNTIPSNTLTNGESYYYTIEASYLTGRYAQTIAQSMSAGSYYFTLSGVNYTFTITSQINAGTTIIFDRETMSLLVGQDRYAVDYGANGTQITLSAQEATILSSQSAVFFCLSAVLTLFSNLTSGAIVTDYSFVADFVYQQNESEPIYELIARINKTDGTLAYTSGSIFSFANTSYQKTLTSQLSAAAYHFEVNGLNYQFVLTSAIAPGNILRFDTDTSKLYNVSGQTETEIAITQGAAGTAIVLSEIVQHVPIAFYGLDDRTPYAIYVSCVTKNGMQVQSAPVSFMTQYDSRAIYGVLDAKNEPKIGAVRISSNMAAIDGVYAGGEAPVYISDSAIDLSADGTKVVFPDGFSVNGSFAVICIARSLVSDTTFMVMSNASEEYCLSFYVRDFGDGELAYITFKQNNTGFFLMSNTISVPDAEDWITIRFVKFSGLFDLQISAE